MPGPDGRECGEGGVVGFGKGMVWLCRITVGDAPAALRSQMFREMRDDVSAHRPHRRAAGGEYCVALTPLNADHITFSS
jgi:hypothetical protein